MGNDISSSTVKSSKGLLSHIVIVGAAIVDMQNAGRLTDSDNASACIFFSSQKTASHKFFKVTWWPPQTIIYTPACNYHYSVLYFQLVLPKVLYLLQL